MKNCYLIANDKIITYKLIKKHRLYAEIKHNKDDCSFRQSLPQTYFSRADAVYELFRRDCFTKFEGKGESLKNYLASRYPSPDYFTEVLIEERDYVTGYSRKVINPIYVDRFYDEYPEYLV